MTAQSAPGSIRRRRRATVAALATALLATAGPAAADSTTAPKAGGRPTVVLVHGAFADASSWNGVVRRLRRDGYPVLAPANPLRGIPADSAYLASVLATVKGPVVLVGHSYGGAVISSAAAGDPNVKALVYVSAFMPDKGETAAALSARFPGSELNPALEQRPFRGAGGFAGTDLYIRPDAFHRVFAADLPSTTADTMAVTQRPIDASAFNDRPTAAAWRTIPSWALVASRDRAISPALERYEARRAHAHTVEVNSSHVAMISHPDAVTDLILSAAGHTDDPGRGPALADTGARIRTLGLLGAGAAAAVLAGTGLVAGVRRRGRPSS